MKTIIVIPCMDIIYTAFVNKLYALERGPEDFCVFSQSSLIYEARNQLGIFAEKNQADYMLWLDSDMIFEPDLLNRMLKSIGNHDFLTGLYFDRRPPFKPEIFEKAKYKQEGNMLIPIAEHYFKYPKNSIFEVEACGFGCVLMKTKVFTETFEKRGLPFSPVLGFGEDISFCIKARECGFKLYCDSSIQVGHIGQTVINEETFKVWRERDVSKG